MKTRGRFRVFEAGDIAPDEVERARRFLGEDDRGRASAGGFEPHAAGPREKIGERPPRHGITMVYLSPFCSRCL